MTDIDQLKNDELKNLEDEEILDLESLILDGADAKIPIEVKYKDRRFGAMIRPLTNVEWNNAYRKAFKNNKTSNEVELLKIGLYKKNGDQFPADSVEKLPTGIVNELIKEIARISGIELNTRENKELAIKMMGF